MQQNLGLTHQSIGWLGLRVLPDLPFLRRQKSMCSPICHLGFVRELQTAKSGGLKRLGLTHQSSRTNSGGSGHVSCSELAWAVRKAPGGGLGCPTNSWIGHLESFLFTCPWRLPSRPLPLPSERPRLALGSRSSLIAARCP